jgi:NitT/TauT family transport system permease protein
MGVILLSLIWLDTEITPIFVSSLIIFPILYRNVLNGIKSLDRGLMEFHRVHNVPRLKQLIFFYIPSLAPFLRSGCVAGLGLGFKAMVTAEVLGQPQTAIGTIFQIERARLNTAAVIGWSIILIILSYVFEQLIDKIGVKRKR